AIDAADQRHALVGQLALHVGEAAQRAALDAKHVDHHLGDLASAAVVALADARVVGRLVDDRQLVGGVAGAVGAALAATPRPFQGARNPVRRGGGVVIAAQADAAAQKFQREASVFLQRSEERRVGKECR